MDEATREARRKALAEEVARLKRAAEQPGMSDAPGAAETSDEEDNDELDWDVEAGDQESDDEPRNSLNMADPNLDALDSSWDDQEEPEIPEPVLPEEKLDPVAYAEAKAAYAAAKAARAEREEARRERKRTKDATKKARQKQRVLQAKQKQKGKSKKQRAPAPKSTAKVERAREKKVEAIEEVDTTETETREASPKKKSRAIEKKPAGMSSTNMMIIAVVVLVFIGAIGFAFFRTH